ncbi:hypothetical protein PVAG01_08150 [Phlyctema vagabunda]|uniref:Uncharacterized protein n=1 Tax=Phlyctema vagabunda TaxID=108571 RepID=A0ABR4P8S4_9HELO
MASVTPTGTTTIVLSGAVGVTGPDLVVTRTETLYSTLPITTPIITTETITALIGSGVQTMIHTLLPSSDESSTAITTDSDDKSTSSTRNLQLITNPTRISSYNLGPLTTQYAVPPSCLETYTNNLYQTLYFGGVDFDTGVSYVDTACHPPRPTLSVDQAVDALYYSPGRCPSGWNYATTMHDVSAGATSTLSLGASTTAALCCPGGYSSYTSGNICGSSVSGSETRHVISATTGPNHAYTVGDLSTTVLSETVIYGLGVPVWWQSADLPAFTPTVNIASSAAALPNPTGSPTDTGTVVPPVKPGALSTGAKIGIGIGVPALVIALALGAYLVYARRKRQVQRRKPEEVEMLEAAERTER